MKEQSRTASERASEQGTTSDQHRSIASMCVLANPTNGRNQNCSSKTRYSERRCESARLAHIAARLATAGSSKASHPPLHLLVILLATGSTPQLKFGPSSASPWPATLARTCTRSGALMHSKYRVARRAEQRSSTLVRDQRAMHTSTHAAGVREENWSYVIDDHSTHAARRLSFSRGVRRPK